MRIVKKIAVYLVSITLVLSVLVTVLTYIFEDDIKQYAVDQLNKNLTAPVKVEQIEFSLWKRFPYASLEFKNLFVPGVYDDGTVSDTMFFAERLYMKLDVIDLLKGDYVVDHVGASSGVVKVQIDEHGSGNYNIWKSDDSNEDKNEMAFNLNHVALHDCAFLYDNKVTGQRYTMGLNNAVLKGNFYEEIYDIHGNLNMQIHNIREDSVNLISNRSGKANVHLTVDNSKGLYHVKKGNLQIGDLNFNVIGKVISDSTTICDLQIGGKDIRLSSLFSSFSSTIGSYSGYTSTGAVSFNATIKGEVSSEKVPQIFAAFEYSNGNVKEPESGVQLENVSLKGSYTNSNEDLLDELLLESFEGTLPDGKIAGYFKMTDFSEPLIETKLSGNLDLATAQKFLKLNTVSRIEGKIDLETDVKVKMTKPESEEKHTIRIYRSKGTCVAQDVSLKLKDSDMQFSEMNGTVHLRNHDAIVDELTAMVGSSDLVCEGRLNNLLPYIMLKNEDLNIIADLESGHIQLEDFIGSSQTTVSESSSSFALPDNINFILDLDVDNMKYAYFEADDVGGKMSMVDKILNVRNVRLKTAGGRLKGDLRIDGRGEKFLLATQVDIEKMNVKTLFNEFENFGQTMIQPSNIDGTIAAEVSLECELNSDLEVDQKSIKAIADVHIRKGELIELSTLNEITKYMRSKRTVNALFARHINDIEKRLKHIKFDDLENQISVKNGVVTIPKMEILSDALNINLAGEHGFDDKIDYSFDFRFRDLKVDENDSEFGRIIDDGTGIQIFIRMFGTVDDPKFEMDKASRKEHLKEEFDHEKKQAKAVLQQSLGLYKKDTTLKVDQKPETEPEFILYDDEDSTQNQEDNDSRKRNKRKNGRLYDKLINKNNNSQQDSVIFEIGPIQ